MRMDDGEFWKLIGLIDIEALEDGDEAKALAPLSESLAAMQASDIEAFHEQLAQALFAIDGARYAEHAEDNGATGDSFLYARCYVVARGEAHYLKVKANPAEMPRDLDEHCESLLYVAQDATGDWSFRPTVSYETGSNEPLWGETSASNSCSPTATNGKEWI